jgi:hypothetical protein
MEWKTFKEKPPRAERVLVVDQWGYITIEEVPREGNLRAEWKRGNGTNLVAWMPLPERPVELCRKDADGQIPIFEWR